LARAAGVGSRQALSGKATLAAPSRDASKRP
jgi:hypothetical protein